MKPKIIWTHTGLTRVRRKFLFLPKRLNGRFKWFKTTHILEKEYFGVYDGVKSGFLKINSLNYHRFSPIPRIKKKRWIEFGFVEKIPYYWWDDDYYTYEKCKCNKIFLKINEDINHGGVMEYICKECGESRLYKGFRKR